MDRSEIERLREQARSGTATKEALENDVLSLLEKNEVLEKRVTELEGELEAQKSAWAEYAELAKQEAEEEQDAGGGAPRAEGFGSVSEAYAAAKEKFGGEALVFLEPADESAEQSPFANPARVYQLFEAIHDVASRWRKNGGKLGMSWEQAFTDRGFEYKDKISQTTKTKYGEEYTFKYEGKPRLFQMHVTVGSGDPNRCLSVHWYRDDNKRVLAIGHCGRHLSNTKT